MKSTLLTSTILLATPTLGCLGLFGNIQWNKSDGYISVRGSVDDNDLRVCDASWGWRLDNDGHAQFECLPGYIYATDGVTSWYANNGGGSFVIDNGHILIRDVWHWEEQVFC